MTQRINNGTDSNIDSFVSYSKAKSTAEANGISTKYTHNKVIKGRVNQPIGIMQVLYERGFINPELKVKNYCEKSLKINGTINEGIRYKEMKSNLPDFLNEKSRLEFYGDKLGVMVDSSPKYHPELAGEGIEFC